VPILIPVLRFPVFLFITCTFSHCLVNVLPLAFCSAALFLLTVWASSVSAVFKSPYQQLVVDKELIVDKVVLINKDP
jgi:formate/nitrite transporter FocA (FNT family)